MVQRAAGRVEFPSGCAGGWLCAMPEQPFPSCVPVLGDGHVRLRAHRPADLARIVEQSRDPDSMRWTTIPRPYSQDDGRAWLAAIEAGWNDPHGVRHWAVTDASDERERYLGTVDLRPQRGGAVAETGFGLHPDGRGQGLMAGALRLVCQWWFGGDGSHVQWRAVRGNFASWRVAWACGFTHHGTLPGSHPNPDGGPVLDTWQASLAADSVTEPRTPWCEPAPLSTDAADGLVLRAWRDEDVESLEPRDQPAHHMPARGVLDADTFPEWLMTRREKMSLGTAVSAGASPMPPPTVRSERPSSSSTRAPWTTTRRSSATRCSRAPAGAASPPRPRALVVEHAFTPTADGGLGMRRLVAQTAEDNAGSNAVLDALGFEIWGRESAADVLPDGRTTESLHWELLRS